MPGTHRRTAPRAPHRAFPVRGPSGRIIGTGAAVGPGLLLTALHVVDPEPRAVLRVGADWPVRQVAALPLSRFGSQRTAAWASYRRVRTLTGVDAGTVDLALLAVPGLRAAPLEVRREHVRCGERLTVVGYPMGRLTVTAGPVTGIDDADFVAHIVLGPGASGSPAIDDRGRLAGIAVMDHEMGTIFIGPMLVAEFVARCASLLEPLMRGQGS